MGGGSKEPARGCGWAQAQIRAGPKRRPAQNTTHQRCARMQGSTASRGRELHHTGNHHSRRTLFLSTQRCCRQKEQGARAVRACQHPSRRGGARKRTPPGQAGGQAAAENARSDQGPRHTTCPSGPASQLTRCICCSGICRGCSWSWSTPPLPGWPLQQATSMPQVCTWQASFWTGWCG